MVTMDNYEAYMLLYADGELDDAGQKELFAFTAAHPQLKAELAAYEATRMQPDMAQVYSNKDELMKPAGTKRISLHQWWKYGAAAGVILVVLLGLYEVKRQSVEGKNDLVVGRGEVNSDSYQKSKVKIQNSKAESNSSEPVVAVNEVKSQKSKVKRERSRDETVGGVSGSGDGDPVVVKQSIEGIAASSVKPIYTDMPAHTVAEQAVPDVTALLVPEHVTGRQSKGLLAWLPFSKEKKEGLRGLKNNVSEKLSNTKNVADNLASTELVLRVGGKDLIVLNF